MCKVTVLLDKPNLLEQIPLILYNKISYVKIVISIRQQEEWFDWGSKFQDKPIIFSLQDGTIKERINCLIQAANIFDLVELNAEFDLTERLLKKIPKKQRFLYWKGAVNSSEDLNYQYKKLQKVGAIFYELVTLPKKAADLLIPLTFQKENAINHLITYAGGLSGMWTQIISAHFGGAMVFGNLGENQLPFFSLNQLLEDYNFPNLYCYNEIYGIAGNPVLNSRSPKIHNGAYRLLNIPAIYLPFHLDDFDDFWKGIIKNRVTEAVGLKIVGLTCVSPYKEKGIKYVDIIDNPLIAASKAGNLLVKQDKLWLAKTTDSLGVLNGLKEKNIPIAKLTIAVIGCGGTGRTIAAALKKEGAAVTLVNRSAKRGVFAAKVLQLPFVLLQDFQPGRFDLVVNATPIGKHGNDIPFRVELMNKNSIVVDVVYKKETTQLIKIARRMGLLVIDGLEILRTQVQYQFQGMTGYQMPKSVATQLTQPVDSEETMVNEHLIPPTEI